ncbi:glycosyltransferase [Ferrimonas aestuarii]|uniref:Glycosyltransferase n=1 Tax=Ferrimonas aestuarii TaxID=2569539 RepID=A0A4U1BLH0_9GAMM|nr:glycosyltransferase [Ferrimonas aestuarii]TKB53939.1 glycosyltransferase [Ferrimonas aestuarii]
MKKVTVYLITQNRKQLLVRAIESVLQQDYDNLELIVVDDCSTDGTADVLADYENEPRLRYFINERIQGACYSRNRAIKHASGELITGLDDDDYFEPNRVSELVEAYSDDYAFVCSCCNELSQDGTKIYRPNGFPEGEFGLDALLHNNLVGNQVLTSKAKFESVGGFDVEMPAFQDFDTWVRLLAKYPKAAKISSPSYVLQTDHGSQRISSSSNRKLDGLTRFIAKHKRHMTSAHLKSMKILKFKVSGSKYGLGDLISSISVHNYRSALSLYLAQNCSGLKQKLDGRKAN